MKAVVYVRARNDNPEIVEKIVDEQVTKCEDYCDHQGYEISGYYIDRSDLKDPLSNHRQLNDLIKDSVKGEWNVVIVTDPSRIARDRADYFKYHDMLKEHNVDLICTTGEVI